MAGTTGRVDRISRAGAPRSSTMRTLFTTATGTEVREFGSAADGEACCEKASAAPGETSSTIDANERAYRGNNIPCRPAQPMQRNISLADRLEKYEVRIAAGPSLGALVPKSW